MSESQRHALLSRMFSYMCFVQITLQVNACILQQHTHCTIGKVVTLRGVHNMSVAVNTQQRDVAAVLQEYATGHENDVHVVVDDNYNAKLM